MIDTRVIIPNGLRFAIIDGTGPAIGYEKAMAKSFCRVLANQLGEVSGKYLRGPTTSGMEVFDESIQAFNWLADEHRRNKDIVIMLAGYSRGGSAAIMTAELLDAAYIDVAAMFLFDPVGRHVFPGGTVIPANVKFSRIARRDQSLSFVMQYEGTLSDDPRLGKTSNPTRPSFDNVGLSWKGFNDHRVPKVFKGSHGALGGVGWKFVTEDANCQASVSGWMGAQMQSRGLTVDLGSGSLDPTPPLQPARLTRFLGQAVDVGLLANSAVNRLTSGWRGF